MEFPTIFKKGGSLLIGDHVSLAQQCLDANPEIQDSIPHSCTFNYSRFKRLYETRVYSVYCDYSLLEAPLSSLLASTMLDSIFLQVLIFQLHPASTPDDQTLSITTLKYRLVLITFINISNQQQIQCLQIISYLQRQQETNDNLFLKDIKDIKDKDMQRIRMRIHHFQISLSLSFKDI